MLYTPGKPAALGGMKKGDIITAINGKTVNNIQDYMFRMGQLKHGQTISVEVLRDEQENSSSDSTYNYQGIKLYISRNEKISHLVSGIYNYN